MWSGIFSYFYIGDPDVIFVTTITLHWWQRISCTIMSLTDNVEAALAGAAGPAVTGVSLKLPPFWANDPAIWFAQIEAQFATKGITQEQTKFSHVISSLQPDVATEVRDLLLNPLLPKTSPTPSWRPSSLDARLPLSKNDSTNSSSAKSLEIELLHNSSVVRSNFSAINSLNQAFWNNFSCSDCPWTFN